MNNFEKIKNFSIYKMARMLKGLLNNRCSFPEYQYCKGCSLEGLCGVSKPVKSTYYSIKKWLQSESED